MFLSCFVTICRLYRNKFKYEKIRHFYFSGGIQMASMVNEDGLNARDLAIHGGHLELAKLLKNGGDQPQQQPRDYEFPVLKPLVASFSTLG